MNTFSCTGNLGRSAEVKTLRTGSSVLVFPLANSVGYGENKSTLWLSCSLFGNEERLSKLAGMLSKGSKVYASGEIKQREWTNESGETKTSLELRCIDVDILQYGDRAESSSSAVQKVSEHVDDSDEIPF